jgi:hypothetical protein
MKFTDVARTAEKWIHYIGRGFAIYISLVFVAAFLYAMYLLARDIVGLPPVH